MWVEALTWGRESYITIKTYLLLLRKHIYSKETFLNKHRPNKKFDVLSSIYILLRNDKLPRAKYIFLPLCLGFDS